MTSRRMSLALKIITHVITDWIEVGAFYWTVLAPGIVNSGREEQGSVSV